MSAGFSAFRRAWFAILALRYRARRARWAATFQAYLAARTLPGSPAEGAE